MSEERQVLLSVRDLKVDFGSRRRPFHAVKGVSFDIYRGETFGLVGESGSGKTTIGRAIIRIYETAGGEVVFGGEKINGRISKALDRQVTRKIQMIFQDPMASLNERAKVDYIVSEGLYNSDRKYTPEERKEKVHQALLDVGLLPEFASRFPHEFSGGQRQRIGIARALIMEPEFIVADEPISALDVSIRAQVLNLLAELQKERGLTYLFISHDLSVMRFICDRIAVIHKGLLMELADTETLFRHPLHPYTRALLSAVPMPSPDHRTEGPPLIYDESVHDYSADAPAWGEIEPGHFVRANQKEWAEYQKILEEPAD
ncbi:MAG: ATP-binding cassette domain-containing protein [Clostridia bacterium]|nr:ATP-binding cassette domain-containing protein [Clostridia bacterium]